MYGRSLKVTVPADDENDGELEFDSPARIDGVYIGSTSRVLLMKIMAGDQYLLGTQWFNLAAMGTAGAAYLPFPGGVMVGPGRSLHFYFLDGSSAENVAYVNAVGVRAK